jgi:hypothetical protein
MLIAILIIIAFQRQLRAERIFFNSFNGSQSDSRKLRGSRGCPAGTSRKIGQKRKSGI